MLTLRPTPNLAGLSVSGDLRDLQSLYDSLVEMVGDEPLEGSGYEMPAQRVLAFCEEIREAWRGCRQVIFEDNGLGGMRQNLKVLAPVRNLYYMTRVAVPEILFITMALGDFVEMGSRRTKLPDLDPAIQRVRCFQAEAAAALGSLLDETSEQRFMKLIYGSVPRYRSFYTHYVDALTSKYLEQPPALRRQQIIPLARRLDELGDDYRRLAAELEETAAEMDCRVADLEPVKRHQEMNDDEW